MRLTFLLAPSHVHDTDRAATTRPVQPARLWTKLYAGDIETLYAGARE
jgi:hypothetical protein